MCHCVLNNESFYTLGVCKDHAEPYRASVILQVKRVTREPERFGEMVRDLGAVIERVREFLRIRPIAVSEPWVIGSDQVIAIGKPGE